MQHFEEVIEMCVLSRGRVSEFFELSYDRQGLSNSYKTGDNLSHLQYNCRQMGRYSSDLALNIQSCCTPMKNLFAGLLWLP